RHSAPSWRISLISVRPKAELDEHLNSPRVIERGIELRRPHRFGVRVEMPGFSNRLIPNHVPEHLASIQEKVFRSRKIDLRISRQLDHRPIQKSRVYRKTTKPSHIKNGVRSVFDVFQPRSHIETGPIRLQLLTEYRHNDLVDSRHAAINHENSLCEEPRGSGDNVKARDILPGEIVEVAELDRNCVVETRVARVFQRHQSVDAGPFEHDPRITFPTVLRQERFRSILDLFSLGINRGLNTREMSNSLIAPGIDNHRHN